jgi:hypothetical protein
MRTKRELRVPEKPADEGECQHRWLADGHRTTQEDKLNQEDSRIMQSGECGQELLHQKGGEQ